MSDRGLTLEQATEHDRLQEIAKIHSECMRRANRSRKTYGGGDGGRREGAGRPRTDGPRCYCGATTMDRALRRCHVCYFNSNKAIKGFRNSQKAYGWLERNQVGGVCCVVVNGRVRIYDPSSQRLYAVAIDGTQNQLKTNSRGTSFEAEG